MASFQSSRAWPVAAGLALLISLTACGGGDGDVQTEPPAVSPEVGTINPYSTALASNENKTAFTFDQHVEHVLRLDVPALAVAMQGSVLVLKLSDGDGRAVYLGTVSRTAALELLVSLPRHHQQMNLELFSNSSADTPIQQEIVL